MPANTYEKTPHFLMKPERVMREMSKDMIERRDTKSDTKSIPAIQT